MHAVLGRRRSYSVLHLPGWGGSACRCRRLSAASSFRLRHCKIAPIASHGEAQANQMATILGRRCGQWLDKDRLVGFIGGRPRPAGYHRPVEPRNPLVYRLSTGSDFSALGSYPHGHTILPQPVLSISSRWTSWWRCSCNLSNVVVSGVAT